MTEEEILHQLIIVEYVKNSRWIPDKNCRE
jgi:hypothetical protein